MLAGTARARTVCAAVRGFDVEASLAGLTEIPEDLGVPTRTGGFGGEAGFRVALDGVAAVLDATHLFAARITARAVRVCGELEIPYLRLTVPRWIANPRWNVHDTVEVAAAAMPEGARVFLSGGPGSAGPFLGRELRLWCRRIDPAPAISGMTWIVGRPPFAEVAEHALLSSLRITHLVTKHSGGARAKLDAAAALGIAVHVIDRPPPGPGEETDDIDRAIDFVRAHAAHRD